MERSNGNSAGKTADFNVFAAQALNPKRTNEIFVNYGSLFVEVCARWIVSGENSESKIAAFGRILPLAPHLAEHAEHFLSSVSQSPILGLRASRQDLSRSQESELLPVLLGTFRLLSFDCRNFTKHVRPLELTSLFYHASKTVQYLAVRCFCLYVHSADHATQEMVKKHVGKGEVMGEWEGETVDYRFLSLCEEKRWTELQAEVQNSNHTDLVPLGPNVDKQLSPYTVNVHGVLLPRLNGVSSQERPVELVATPTSDANLRRIAMGLLGPSPILLTGLAGSGKTLLVRHFAWLLNKLSSMVTLHLNEQSDAKLLVGMYTTGAKPGSFSWRPGVLTTAVREGRWIFIEDLDRAPNDVISTLLPLIERGELLIPSRGETVRAARGFRIIATMRSTLNPRGQEIVPRQNMIGHRFWNSITVQMPELREFETVITAKYSTLKAHVPGIMRVYARLLSLFSDAKFSSENGTSLRALTPRDLLKWCDRIAVLLSSAKSFTVSKTDDIFMEALDCFAGSLRSEGARSKLMACVAEELHIDPQRKDHLLTNREVKLEVPPKGATGGTIRIGRARLAKHKTARKQGPGRPFSTNDYTLRLLEKVAVAVDRQEPLLLVGETGTGKTTAIQYLADQLGRKLVAFNLSQQSESGDLLGGYKPVNVRSLIIPLKDEFDDIFDTTFSRKKNLRFLEMLGKRMAKGEWKRVCMLWREALKMVDSARKAHESRTTSPDPDGGQPKKKRKVESMPANFPAARWEKFTADLHDLEAQLASGSDSFAFSFLEGNIVKAVRNGDWVLLDEINLASPDTLEALVDLLGGGPDGAPSVLLTETGNVERVVAHPNFRVFAAMNPATDVGKKDLPPGIRSRFTELYVESPDSDIKSLRNIVEKYLGGDTIDPAIVKLALDVTNLYLDIQRLARSNMLVDGADQKPHFSLRTLTRTLSYARDIAPLCTLRRALYEGFHMSFLTFLGKPSEELVAPLITKHLFSQKGSTKAELGRPLQQPADGRNYVRLGHYWLRQGSYTIEEQSHYIITPFVQRNLNNLIRASSTRRYPVLIQGPTSSGKTSMIEYLAKQSGNKFVRINNHEHTDLQEYLGSYISGTDGKLVFQEGILVKALREGHWIVLDELNLAPTDVLEALNRLLDDNRELLIPETQEIVRPHEDFMLFATQNPAGLYGGRKVLSRAFRNRFLELHFDDIPVEELTEILHRRTMIPESWCKRIVKVYQELSTLRQENRLFEQKSFATLRDLFRWAQRKAETIQDIANNGYMLLAERVRKEEERQAVKKVIEDVMSKNGPRVQIDEEKLYSENLSPEIKLSQEKAGNDQNAVWTRAMRRLFVLVANAIRNNEPVLLVGETGCGKTTVCQMLADAFSKQLHIVNAHQNTETGDLIGAQRPIRNRAAIEDLLHRQLATVLLNLPNSIAMSDSSTLSELLGTYDKLDAETMNTIPMDHRNEIQANRIKAAALFEWADGSMVHAMKTGQFFLLDEISLADDSVLERLNSVLESSRTLLLAEKGPTDSLIIASEGFQFLATMNPGGDYGKRELSPALRNRFTEIWVPALSDVEDILQIVQSKLKPSMAQYAGSIVSFAQWFNQKFNTSVASSISIRDTLAWVSFINGSQVADPVFSIVHGAAMVFIDTLGANPAGLLAISPASIDEERRECLHRLTKLLGSDVSPFYFGKLEVVANDQSLQVGTFSIPRFSHVAEDPDFSLEAPTTRSNAMRVIRALQLAKPILLEGNPGVGKTTLVTAIARATGKPLTRLNLSEQTDLMDLFGSDVPMEGGQAGNFAWRDAPFLKAMKNGDWVLLDEMNLASQSVLEGLNAVLDHRGEVYISELDQTFHKHPDFRVFAAQNPHHQGGGRKGLPASFVNRFTVVYAEVFHPEDLSLICTKVFPNIPSEEIEKLIRFVATLDEHVQSRAFGALGAPWEFNLRDTLRWLSLLGTNPKANQFTSGSARDFLDAVFLQRFRSQSDRARLLQLFEGVYGAHKPRITLFHNLGHLDFQVGVSSLTRDAEITRANPVSHLRVHQLGAMEALMVSVQQNWPTILVGQPGAGKTAMVEQFASLVGADLEIFSMNADIDAMDLVGGYEQLDPSRETQRVRGELEQLIRRSISNSETPETSEVLLLEALHLRASLKPEKAAAILDSLRSEAVPEHVINLVIKYFQLLQTPQQIEGARFQWVDGILIQALREGKWLVLDNANLCSSAVLDRLNSLLEPNGYLSINEHPTADGEARIVRPHTHFRIFFTMDPRFGELSRAMRNRAVEICLLTNEDDDGSGPATIMPAYPLESEMYRFRHLGPGIESVSTMEVRTEHLAFMDSELLPSFAYSSGVLAPRAFPVFADGSTSNNTTLSPDVNRADFPQMVKFMTQTWGPKVLALRGLIDIILRLPYHPLTNELYLHNAADTKDNALQLAWLYDLSLNLFNIRNSLQTLPSAKFERRVEKQKLPAFLHGYCRTLVKALEALWNMDLLSIESSGLILRLQTLFWAFLEMAQGHGFDRATFQTYVKMLNAEILRIAESDAAMSAEVSQALTNELKVFGSEVKLKTGLGMERIWKHFRSTTPKTSFQLAAVLELETLADRLDAAMWRSSLKLDEMVQIRERFASALHLARTQDVDIAELLLNLSSAARELESQIVEEDAERTPYFEGEFEGLCQFLDVLRSNKSFSKELVRGATDLVRARSLLLARRPTRSFNSESSNAPSEVLARLYTFAGLGRPSGQEMVLQGRFHIATLQKIAHAEEVQLVHLDRFEAELQVLSQHISLESDNITRAQQDALSRSYWECVDELVASHSDIISYGDSAAVELRKGSRITNQYRQALEGQLTRAVQHLQSTSTDLSSTSQAWIDLALAGLSLYIPNYPHDPALQPMIERKLFNQKKAALVKKLQALQEFQLSFTGQETSFRIRYTEGQIEAMGQEPPVPAIARPEVSELDSLQGEFTNLLSLVQPLLNGTISAQEASHDETLRSNLTRIIGRLVDGYRSYDDITGSAVGFLACLHIGLTLGAQAAHQVNSIRRSLEYVTQHTPFFGITGLQEDSRINSLIQHCESELSQGQHAIDLRMHALHCIALARNVELDITSRPGIRRILHDIFASYYSEWRQKLLQDQEKEAINSSLYTYKGGDEELDEEDPELFPDYEKEEDEQAPASSTSREHAIRLSNMHAELFHATSPPEESLKALLEWSTSQIVRVADGQAHGTKHENAMPAIFLALDKKADALSSSGAGKGYNFYFDSNITEAKRLITLIHRIQRRYRQIRNVWPEHATLSDVLRTCDEALEFRHVDPVAKFITKGEKLHSYMYEWERVASREFSTATLFDDLTKLLVSWRQLELTTWARLFDIEIEKCKDNARGWFFVAYETIVAAPESIQDEKEMRQHAKDLLKTLEGFFSSTTLGQFKQRMGLLEQLREHLAMRMQDVAFFSIVHLALDNLIAYLGRLEKPVQEALSKGRQALEKTVSEVIQLASWKDTNIEALKQSAKTSHRKLSKLVRKFRALLNQPVSGIYHAGFPEETVITADINMGQIDTTLSPNVLDLLDRIPDWAAQPTRFRNPSATVSIMRSKSSVSAENVDSAKYIESFIVDLETVITELQKATPPTLTEKNKETVQHLKTRKRKLYADTMKELRQMGIKSNLSSDVLVKQDELSTVLASLPTVKSRTTGSEYFLHKALNVMSQVRDITKEHSGDLTGNDVVRSIGYLEGLLHATVRQRSLLSRAIKIREAQWGPIRPIVNFSTLVQDEVTRVSDEQVTGFDAIKAQCLWLSVILNTSANITAAQAKLGKTNEFDSIVQGLREWSKKFSERADATQREVLTLPSYIWSQAHTDVEASMMQMLGEFREIFNTWMEECPLPRAILQHIEPFIGDHIAITTTELPESARSDLEAKCKDIFAALDLILGAMQDVETALKDVPTSTEDASWLVNEEQALSVAIVNLHSGQITKALQNIVDQIHCLQQTPHLQAIATLFAAVMPILNQYMASHEYLVAKLDSLHTATAKLLYRLAKSFIQVGTQGFCTPPEKSSENQPGKDDKLESGTGLGEGEGAEDISKDIEEDEDLEDLAQEKGGEREGSIEEEEDAVDMGENEMEGEMGEVADKEDDEGEGEEGDDDIQSEVGSVDDLGPSAVDEKMWDEGGKDDDDAKDKEGKQDVGTENQDEQVAAEDKDKKEKGKEEEEGEKEEGEGADEDEDADMQGEEQEENIGVGETEQMDPHAKEEETLDLPDELNLEGDEDEKENDDMGDMDMGDDPEEEMDTEEGAKPDTIDEEIGSEHEDGQDQDTTDHKKDDEEMGDEEEEGDEPVDDDAIPLPDEQAPPDEPSDAKNDTEADPNAEAGAGAEANDEAHQHENEQASASAANQDKGAEDATSENNQEAAAEDGTLGQTTKPDAGGRGEDAEESPETQSFKKLGDVLERWYNQQRQISDAKEKDETQIQQIDKEVDMADADFEHVPDDETQADTQALGTATEEQAKALDEDMAMAVDEEEKIAARPEDNDEQVQEQEQDMDMPDAESKQEEQEVPQSKIDGQPQAFVGEQKPFEHQQDQDMSEALPAEEDFSETSSVDDVETQLESTHLDPSILPTPETARQLWLRHESSTHSLSQQLTEHLRLILAPTLATKLRGDFRTGKRLNLKRIIPYIASGYKRDKIWLRRSMPSKRNYQVMIALDDSKSMAESGASNLALKTLTLVTRSLSMLEVGEVSVVGFGDQVNVAHDFDKPFTSDAGVRVFEQFGFAGSKTNVRGLVDKSLGLFEEARRKGSGVGEELWQLMLIVSDGICDSHAEIQRLVRKAQEERVMIVFIIIDATATPPTAADPSATEPAGPSTLPLQPQTDTAMQKKSILDLQAVDISPDGKIDRWKYMERFPFRYYLVVRDVRELPGVLAGALRQWFGEVAGSA